MSKYLIIESRDPFESPDVGQMYQLAGELSQDGNDVTVFLIQNGVLAAREKSTGNALNKLISAGKIQVLADDYSLGERGIESKELGKGISISNIDNLVDLMLAADEPKLVWH